MSFGFGHQFSYYYSTIYAEFVSLVYGLSNNSNTIIAYELSEIINITLDYICYYSIYREKIRNRCYGNHLYPIHTVHLTCSPHMKSTFSKVPASILDIVHISKLWETAFSHDKQTNTNKVLFEVCSTSSPPAISRKVCNLSSAHTKRHFNIISIIIIKYHSHRKQFIESII